MKAVHRRSSPLGLCAEPQPYHRGHRVVSGESCSPVVLTTATQTWWPRRQADAARPATCRGGPALAVHGRPARRAGGHRLRKTATIQKKTRCKRQLYGTPGGLREDRSTAYPVEFGGTSLCRIREGATCAALVRRHLLDPGTRYRQTAQMLLEAMVRADGGRQPLLSEREPAVLRQLPGHRDKETAAALGLSVHGVRHHLRKLSVARRADAVRRAKELGLIPDASRNRAIGSIGRAAPPDNVPRCACSTSAAALQSRALDPGTANAMFHQAPHAVRAVDVPSMAGVSCATPMPDRIGGAGTG